MVPMSDFVEYNYNPLHFLGKITPGEYFIGSYKEELLNEKIYRHLQNKCIKD